MILLDCPVKQFTWQVSPGVDATWPFGRSQQLLHMADGGAEGMVVKFTANVSGKLLQNLQSWPSRHSGLKAPGRMALDKGASPAGE